MPRQRVRLNHRTGAGENISSATTHTHSHDAQLTKLPVKTEVYMKNNDISRPPSPILPSTTTYVYTLPRRPPLLCWPFDLPRSLPLFCALFRSSTQVSLSFPCRTIMLTKERTKKTLPGSVAYSYASSPHRSQAPRRRFVERQRRTMHLRPAA